MATGASDLHVTLYSVAISLYVYALNVELRLFRASPWKAFCSRLVSPLLQLALLILWLAFLLRTPQVSASDWTCQLPYVWAAQLSATLDAFTRVRTLNPLHNMPADSAALVRSFRVLPAKFRPEHGLRKS